MKLPILLTLAAGLSGALHIYFDYKKNIKATYIFKPLVCFLLIGMVILCGQKSPPIYRNWILAGLLFSMLGDIFLMLKDEKFIQGLTSFLIAHLCYIIAFWQFIDIDKTIPWVSFFALILIAGFVWGYLRNGVQREMKFPVLIYISAITTMVCLARTWLVQTPIEHNGGFTYLSASLAYLGALFFMSSDTNLAINKFTKPYHWAQLLTLTTYYVAQILITWSVLIWFL